MVLVIRLNQYLAPSLYPFVSSFKYILRIVNYFSITKNGVGYQLITPVLVLLFGTHFYLNTLYIILILGESLILSKKSNFYC